MNRSGGPKSIWDIVELLIAGASVAVVCPLVTFVVALCVALFLLREEAVPGVALGGLAVGLLLAIVCMKPLVRRFYQLPTLVLILLYGFLSMVTLCIFMGVPVFQLGLGLTAGLYVGRKLRHARIDGPTTKIYIRRAAVFATAVLTGICALSASIAMLTDTPGELQRMFNPPFQVTWATVWAIILIGGVGLLAAQYWLATWAAWKAFAATNHTEPRMAARN